MQYTPVNTATFYMDLLIVAMIVLILISAIVINFQSGRPLRVEEYFQRESMSNQLFFLFMVKVSREIFIIFGNLYYVGFYKIHHVPSQFVWTSLLMEFQIIVGLFTFPHCYTSYQSYIKENNLARWYRIA